MHKILKTRAISDGNIDYRELCTISDYISARPIGLVFFLFCAIHRNCITIIFRLGTAVIDCYIIRALIQFRSVPHIYRLRISSLCRTNVVYCLPMRSLFRPVPPPNRPTGPHRHRTAPVYYSNGERCYNLIWIFGNGAKPIS